MGLFASDEPGGDGEVSEGTRPGWMEGRGRRSLRLTLVFELAVAKL